MVKHVLNTVVWILIWLSMAGCAVDISQMVSHRLDPAFLNAELETPKINLGALGACPGTLPVRVTSAENRKTPYTVYDAGGGIWHITPDRFIDDVVRYTEAQLLDSGLTIDRGAGRLVYVSLEDATVIGNLTVEASVTLKFDIPELNVTRRYRGVEGSGLGDYALAYGIHLAVVQFIDDPVFQKYVTCRESPPASAPRVTPRAAAPAPKPAVVSDEPKPPPATTSGEPIRVAVFPWEFTNNSGYNKQMLTDRQTDGALKRALDADPRFEVIHTWYDRSSMTVKKTPEAAIDWKSGQRNRVWLKTGALSAPAPDVASVVQMGRRIGAQAVLLVQTREVAVGSSLLTVAIVDVHTGALTAESAEVYYLNYPGILEKMSKSQLDAFLARPRP